MAIAIKIENLSKQYRLGLISTRPADPSPLVPDEYRKRGSISNWRNIMRSQIAGCRSIRPKNNLNHWYDPSSPGNSAKAFEP